MSVAPGIMIDSVHPEFAPFALLVPTTFRQVVAERAGILGPDPPLGAWMGRRFHRQGRVLSKARAEWPAVFMGHTPGIRRGADVKGAQTGHGENGVFLLLGRQSARTSISTSSRRLSHRFLSHRSGRTLLRSHVPLFDGDAALVRGHVDQETDVRISPVALGPGHEHHVDLVHAGPERGVLHRLPVGIGDLVNWQMRHLAVVPR